MNEFMLTAVKLLDFFSLAYINGSAKALLIVGAIIFLLFLNFAFYYRLLYIERTYYPKSWEEDRQPLGPYKMPSGYNLLVSRWAHDRLAREWLFSTPAWVKEDREARILIWCLRIAFLLWILPIFGPVLIDIISN